MRLLATVLALGASLVLAGCSSSQEPHSPVDPEEAETSDYGAGAIVSGALVLVVVSVVAVLFLVRRRRRARTAAAPTAPASPKEKPKGP